MNRRTFLKVLGSVAAALSAPTFLVEANERIPAGAVELGLIREMSQFDIYRDEIMVRYDVLSARTKTQLSLDMRWFQHHAQRPEFRAEQREIAKELLESAMRKHSISWRDLTPLPIPHGYRTPAWL